MYLWSIIYIDFYIFVKNLFNIWKLEKFSSTHKCNVITFAILWVNLLVIDYILNLSIYSLLSDILTQ